jgi:TonB family protein
MSVATDPTEFADPVDAPHPAYASWRLDGVPLEIRISAEVIDGIARDIMEVPEGEIAGALRGRREGDRGPVLWIEGYQRLQAAAETPEDAVGFYRGTASRDGFPDSDGPPDSLLMAVQPDKSGALTAQFFVPGPSGSPEPAHPAFPFRHSSQARVRRLVPDFDQATEPVRPAREFFLQSRPAPEEPDESDVSPAARATKLLARLWPFLAALTLMGAAVWLLPKVFSKQAVAPATPSAAGIARPLGLYVDPATPNWRISWNRDASVLQGAPVVRLFIHDGDEQNGVDLTRVELDSGMYQYQPHGNDVTFRMEATAADGRVSAESFRLMKSPVAVAALPGVPQVSTKTTPPQATRRVAPVVAASLRPRIRGKVLIDIRVQIDNRGRVTSAVPVSRPRKGLETDLAGSAIRAARAWHFEPATRDGKAVSGTQTLHFVFER